MASPDDRRRVRHPGGRPAEQPGKLPQARLRPGHEPAPLASPSSPALDFPV